MIRKSKKKKRERKTKTTMQESYWLLQWVMAQIYLRNPVSKKVELKQRKTLPPLLVREEIIRNRIRVHRDCKNNPAVDYPKRINEFLHSSRPTKIKKKKKGPKMTN